VEKRSRVRGARCWRRAWKKDEENAALQSVIRWAPSILEACVTTLEQDQPRHARTFARGGSPFNLWWRAAPPLSQHEIAGAILSLMMRGLCEKLAWGPLPSMRR
jgi:hypothetical protein